MVWWWPADTWTTAESKPVTSLGTWKSNIKQHDSLPNIDTPLFARFWQRQSAADIPINEEEASLRALWKA
jgi:hypothetical protein